MPRILKLVLPLNLSQHNIHNHNSQFFLFRYEKLESSLIYNRISTLAISGTALYYRDIFISLANSLELRVKTIYDIRPEF